MQHSEEAKEYLLRENEEFQRLAKKHQDLDQRLTVLSKRFLPSQEEKLEETTLKKRKLVLKDQMAEKIRMFKIEQNVCSEHARSTA